MISVFLGKDYKQLEKQIMRIFLAGWLLVWAFVHEADAGTINVRNASQLTSEDALMVEELVPLSRGIPKSQMSLLCTSTIRENLNQPYPSFNPCFFSVKE